MLKRLLEKKKRKAPNNSNQSDFVRFKLELL